MYCTHKIRHTEILMVGDIKHIPRAMKIGFKLVSNDMQALSSLIGLPPVMGREFEGA